jgi:hypothetical protein
MAWWHWALRNVVDAVTVSDRPSGTALRARMRSAMS